MATTLNQREAAKHCRIGVKTFRQICKDGKGPRVWNPCDGLPRYVDTALDEWMHERDDRKFKAAS